VEAAEKAKKELSSHDEHRSIYLPFITADQNAPTQDLYAHAGSSTT
jgi:hypothetical protein